MVRILILTATALAMTSCPDSSTPPPKDLTNEFNREREQRIHAESERDVERAAKDRWQNLALLSTVGAIIALIAGCILGSKAKQDAERHE